MAVAGARVNGVELVRYPVLGGESGVTAPNSIYPYGDVRRYGVVGGAGTTDDTAALQVAVNNAAAVGGVIFFPGGTYKVTSTVNITSNDTRLVGVSPELVTILFVPTVDAVCFNFANGAASVWFDGIEGMKFTSTDTTHTKTMVKATDVRSFIVRQLVSSAGGWTGNNSIGISVSGREVIRLRDLYLYADRPVVFGLNPNFASNSLDHSSVVDSVLVVNSGGIHPVIEILDQSTISRVKFSNLALVGGNGGIYFVKSSGSGTSVGIVVENCRYEQGISSTATYVYTFVDTVVAIQNLAIRDCFSDASMSSVRLNNVSYSVIENLHHAKPGGTALILESNCHSIVVIGLFYEVGSALNFAAAPSNYTLINTRNGTAAAVIPLQIIGVPTSNAGLAAGAIWCDTAAGNVLKRV